MCLDPSVDLFAGLVLGIGVHAATDLCDGPVGIGERVEEKVGDDDMGLGSNRVEDSGMVEISNTDMMLADAFTDIWNITYASLTSPF